MTARSAETFVLAFSDPTIDLPELERARVPENISFELFDHDYIRTLSKNTVSDGADIEGLLYVPDLDPTDSCFNTSQAYIPNNATRKADLPSEQYYHVAFAPWISVPCTKSYLAASVGARALMTYIPDNGATTPPLVNDKIWDLQDGGQWKMQNKFPVYAIPGEEGAAIMQQMGQYSGNTSNGKIADILAQENFDRSDYVRLYTSFGTSEPIHLPTLWAFLLLVLGLVLFIIAATSLLMHYVQRRRRRDLHRRVVNGQVDLESLGIKRTRITQEAIDSLPTSIYTQRRESTDETKAANTNQTSEESSVRARPNPTPEHSHWAQPTCPICLDDFVPDSTTIRSLPCHHIYHPECIDPFLRENSSLCPVCKAAVLSPTSKFYISQPITNAMVRHERRARRTRQEREVHTSANGQMIGEEAESRRWLRRFRYRSGRRAPIAPGINSIASTTNQMELRPIGSAAAPDSTTAGAAVEGAGAITSPPAGADGWREGNGAIPNTLPDRDTTIYDAEIENSARQPRWRKALRAAFPGF